MCGSSMCWYGCVCVHTEKEPPAVLLSRKRTLECHVKHLHCLEPAHTHTHTLRNLCYVCGDLPLKWAG